MVQELDFRESPSLLYQNLTHKILSPLARVYWKIFKPKTFGVRVLIQNQLDTDKVLLIRHTYGNQQLWNNPGGGYRPAKEHPETAAMREVQEELGIAVDNLEELGSYETTGEGKRDTVKLYLTAISPDLPIALNSEVCRIHLA